MSHRKSAPAEDVIDLIAAGDDYDDFVAIANDDEDTETRVGAPRLQNVGQKLLSRVIEQNVRESTGSGSESGEEDIAEPGTSAMCNKRKAPAIIPVPRKQRRCAARNKRAMSGSDESGDDTSAHSSTQGMWCRKKFAPPKAEFTGPHYQAGPYPMPTPAEYVERFLPDDVFTLIAIESMRYFDQRKKPGNSSSASTSGTATPISSSSTPLSAASPRKRGRPRKLQKPTPQRVNTARSFGGDSLDKVKEDYKVLVAMLLAMGLQPLADTLNYWTPDFRVDLIANAMSQDRFLFLMRHLHFVDLESVDPEEETARDRLWKIRPLLKKVRALFLVVAPDENQSIDEQMVSFKGHHSLRQYMKRKPIKFGFKVWARASPDGFVHDFEFYQGKAKDAEAKEASDLGLNLSEYVVIKMIRSLSEHCGYKIFTDRYFTGVNLAYELLKRGQYLSGPILTPRSQGACPKKSQAAGENQLRSDNDLSKLGRGSFDELTSKDGKLAIVKWNDCGFVHVLSTLCGAEPTEECERSEKRNGKWQKITVTRPAVIRSYNRNMGGVDLSDMFRAKYFKSIKCRRWYLYIFHYIISLAVRNAWILYKRDFFLHYGGPSHEATPKMLGLFDFIRDAVKPKLLAAAADRKRLRAPVFAPTSSRFDRKDHWPAFVDHRGSCRVCLKKGRRSEPKTKCAKCKVFLCLMADRDCFHLYHTDPSS